MANCAPQKLLKLTLGADPLPGADAGALVAMAIREGLGGALYRRLKDQDIWKNIPDEQQYRLRQVYYAGVQKNLRLLRALSEILAQVNAADIRVLLLQGVSLLNHMYADIGLRALTDIDLWVLPEDLAGFAGCMQQLGYRPRAHYPQTFIRGNTIVDVHTHLLWADRIRARDRLLPLDQKTIFNAADRLTVEGGTVYRLARADQFIYLAMHCLKHCAQRLVWLADLVTLIGDWKTSDWIALRRRADELGQNRTVHYLLFLLDDLADYRPPQDCRNLFDDAPLNSWEKAVLRIRRNKASLPIWSPLVLLPAGLDPAGKGRFIFESLFPKPPVLRQVFCRKSHLENWQLYGMRALQLLGLVKAD